MKAPVHKGHFERPALPGVLINVSCNYKEEHMKPLTKTNRGDFLVQGSDGGGTFCLLFWNLHKIWLFIRIHRS